MLPFFLGSIADHWFLSTYLGVMVFNESAILTAFSLAATSDMNRILGLGFAATLGALTNDLILYAVGRYGATRFLNKETDGGESAETFFERALLGNVFLALMFMKFFFGIRMVLTVYLVAKKRLSLGKFIAYDILGILLYVAVIGGVGLLVGRGGNGIEEAYGLAVRIVSALCILILVGHLIGRFLRRFRGPGIQNKTGAI